MKRITAVAFCLAVAVYAFPALAHEDHPTPTPAAKAVSKSITGEVVDTGCYLGHAARGVKHVSCATKCINQGMPMGLLTTDGTLYLLTPNHDDADPYNSLKGMAGKTVKVTGTAMSRGGMKGIDVSAVQLAGK